MSLLEYFFGEDFGKVTKFSGILPPRNRMNYCSRTTISETFYILCRREGEKYARTSIESVLMSGYLSVVSSDELDLVAGHYKCLRALSLADCYVLAVAKLEQIPAVFAKREDDLKKELEKDPFDVRLLFLEDQIRVN